MSKIKKQIGFDDFSSDKYQSEHYKICKCIEEGCNEATKEIGLGISKGKKAGYIHDKVCRSLETQFEIEDRQGLHLIKIDPYVLRWNKLNRKTLLPSVNYRTFQTQKYYRERKKSCPLFKQDGEELTELNIGYTLNTAETEIENIYILWFEIVEKSIKMVESHEIYNDYQEELKIVPMATEIEDIEDDDELPFSPKQEIEGEMEANG